MATTEGEVVAYVQEGVGNQLFQYAMARAFALRHGRRLKLDLRHYRVPTNRPYQLDLFNVQYEPFTPLDRFRLAMNHSPKLRSLHPMAKKLAPALLYQIVTDPMNGFDAAAMAAAGRSIYFEGYWQCEKYFMDAAQTLRRELTFKAAPSPRNQQVLDEMASVESVSLHVRRGDYLDNTMLGGLVNLDYYRAAVEVIRGRTRAPHFFVFSDDPDWAAENLPFVQPRTLVCHNRGLDDQQDLRLMNHCRHFVIANSSFSWWGAWLSPHAAKVVIAPTQWFRNRPAAGRDIVPTQWIRL